MDQRDGEAEASGATEKEHDAESQRVLGFPVDWLRSIVAATFRRRG